MKLSLKLEDQHQTQTPILFKAKIPITVFNLPFISGVSATHHHQTSPVDKLSLSLRTFFPNGPSLKLSYNTTTSAVAGDGGTATAPFTVTLKSGISLSGAPNNSPLIISANFSFSPQNPNPNPNFTIQFKPRLGSFSFRKSINSTISNSNKKLNDNGNGENLTNSCRFVQLDRPSMWKEWRVELVTKGPIFSGILMAADTELPVTKRVKVNLQWGVGIAKQLPYLRVKKIEIERVDDVNEKIVNQQQQGIERDLTNHVEFETLKGMCFWMRKELNDLQKENKEMRCALEDIKSLQTLRNRNGYNGGGSTDIESELQKAIKAKAASSSR